MKVTIDIDMRNQSKFQAVLSYFEDLELRKDSEGVESWLRDVGSDELNFHPVRMWIDHQTRQISSEKHTVNHSADYGEDRLDMEYRYWSFMEAHPAHVVLPSNARTEAMDAVARSYADCLLPSTRPIPPPFSQEECQNLIDFLRAFGESTHSGCESVVTIVVSRIHLRVVHWRRMHFCPDIPLPRDILNKDIPRQEPRRPFGRAIVNNVISRLHVSILSPSFNRLPHNGRDGDTRIRHAEPTQKQTFGSCTNRNTPIGAQVVHPDRPDFDIPEQNPLRRRFESEVKLHPDPASSASHVDDAQESLRALQESADAFPNSHLKNVVSGVSALWETAKRIEQSKEEAQAWSQRSLKVLETLAEAVGHDPFNIPPLMLGNIRSFEKYVSETLVESIVGIYLT
ncbi:hypothetical protein F5888DRAFT_618009 [Russula emetica]|nr:hypothetical protein F5888DRAFT_618009 [Russula emetica]